MNTNGLSDRIGGEAARSIWVMNELSEKQPPLAFQGNGDRFRQLEGQL